MRLLAKKAGMVQLDGQDNFCSHIDTALERAAQLEMAVTRAE